ncbi:sterol desaturase family protein [Parvularcula sp. LCG005]|uniref:sterol desaturase family protein n=1 Tax=Parvularcula sp. LCG005 TaxID=3078805 RepID=UPI00294210A9|nr:sterol desaturase family protein [Parvularcula sp. LCG005]WOI53699.1 sterol desaturase family protein [Parvularcula sp. LCG005]
MDGFFDAIGRFLGLDSFAAGVWFARQGEAIAHGRYWWPYLVAGLLAALFAYGIGVRPLAARKGLRGLIAFLIPIKLWRRRSALVDVKMFALNKGLEVVGLFSMSALAIVSAAIIATWTGVDFDLASADAVSTTEAVILVIMLVAALDLAEYAAHRMCHEVKALWAFHRVHHSATTLTPLTASRIHPVEILFESSLMALFAGPVIVFGTAVFGGMDLVLILGTNAFYAILQLSFTHLRHSHVFLRYPKPLCWIFSSPAQHQVHHSRAERHWDRNYGEVFAIWDILFGTYIRPRKNERLVFGLSADNGVYRPRPHETLKDALSEPFIWVRRLWAERRAEKAAQAQNSVSTEPSREAA